MLLGIFVCDDDRALVLERLAAGDVIKVGVAVDQIFYRPISDLFDLGEIGRHRLWAKTADWVGCDHAHGRDYKHRLMTLISKEIDVVRTVDFSGGEWWLSRLRDGNARECEQRKGCRGNKLAPHVASPG